jgi:hypothetical protein
MANKLGNVVDQGCYKNGERQGNAKFCHNCRNQQGNQVIWQFEVLDDNDVVIGHVNAALDCNSRQGKGDESQQKAAILAIARSLVP